ncbi:MAG: hypothetical protein Q7S40_34210 [Opitutaceae bacterium]|nr:hypothetical protein [Opitutaceae bacterium]
MISHWQVGAEDPPNIPGLAAWADGRDATNVLWTSLPPRWGKKDGRCPTVDEVIVFLSGLSGERRAKAQEYRTELQTKIALALKEAAELPLSEVIVRATKEIRRPDTLGKRSLRQSRLEFAQTGDR